MNHVNNEGPRVGDAWGHGLLDAVTDPAVGVVLERDDGFVDFHPMSGYFLEPDNWPAADRWVLERVTGRVLDIGAGAGRAALALQNRGQGVLALDVSPGALTACHRRGVHETFLGSVADLAQTTPDPFDTLLALGNNLSLIGSPREAPSFFEGLNKVSRPRTRLVGTCHDPFQTTNPIHLAYHERNRGLGRPPGQATLRTRYRDIADEWFDLLLLPMEELVALCAPYGWQLVDHLLGPSYAVMLERS